MVNGLLASGKSPSEVEAMLGDLLKLEDTIDSAVKNPSDYLDDIATIHTDGPDGEEVNVDDIPF